MKKDKQKERDLEVVKIEYELMTLLETTRKQSHYINTYLATKEYRLAHYSARLCELYSQRVFLLVQKLNEIKNKEKEA
jgi:hypothetical protein